MRAQLENVKNCKDVTGVLLINTGTPDSPAPEDVKAYLAEFLSDLRLINLPKWKWLPILHGIILRVRPKKTSKRYESYWTEEGSPFDILSESQAALVQQELDPTEELVKVRSCMRYGSNSIERAMKELVDEGVTRFVVMPLFPQYASVTAGTIIEEVFRVAKNFKFIPEICTINNFHTESHYLDCMAHRIENTWVPRTKEDLLIFSYHSTLMSEIEQGDPYHIHVQQTTEGIASRLGLSKDLYVTGYQSVFDKREWLGPLTTDLLQEAHEKGVKNVGIVTPIFTTDCLETYWDVEHEFRDEFLSLGEDKTFRYIPALNDEPCFIDIICDVLKKNVPLWVDKDTMRKHGLL